MSTLTSYILPETHSFTYREHYWNSEELELAPRASSHYLSRGFSPVCKYFLANGYTDEQIDKIQDLHFDALPVYICNCDSKKKLYNFVPCRREFRQNYDPLKNHVFVPDFILEINSRIIDEITPTMDRLIDERPRVYLRNYLPETKPDGSLVINNYYSYKLTYTHWDIVSQIFINYSLAHHNFPEIPSPNQEFFNSDPCAQEILDDIQQMFFSVANLKLPFLKEN